MAAVTIEPTITDKRIANAIAATTTPTAEELAQVLTWGADEKVLLALAIGGWLYAARRPALRPITNHLLTLSLLTAVLPHLLKRGINQTRPDRLTVEGHWRGVPFSGRSRDAFPSGHALHMGALASAAGLFPFPQRWLVRGACGGPVGHARSVAGSLDERCFGRLCGRRAYRTVDPPDHARLAPDTSPEGSVIDYVLAS